MTSLPVPIRAGEVQDNDAIGHLPRALQDAMSAARDFASNEKAESTRRAYAVDFADFTTWCETFGLVSLPASPAAVATYLAACADRKLKASTIARQLAAIRIWHVRKGYDVPTNAGTVKAVHRGIRRHLGARVEQKAAATAKIIAAMLRQIPDGLTGARDRALLLLGFAAALRRSELVGLTVADIERRPEGVFVHIRKSKTDQEALGHVVPVPHGSKLRPVEALDAWLTAAGITEGYLFRPIRKGGLLQVEALTDRSVATIVKRYADARET